MKLLIVSHVVINQEQLIEHSRFPGARILWMDGGHCRDETRFHDQIPSSYDPVQKTSRPLTCYFDGYNIDPAEHNPQKTLLYSPCAKVNSKAARFLQLLQYSPSGWFDRTNNSQIQS